MQLFLWTLLWFDKLWSLTRTSAHIYSMFYSLWTCAPCHHQILISISVSVSFLIAFSRLCVTGQFIYVYKYLSLFCIVSKLLAFPQSLSMNIWFACNYKRRMHMHTHYRTMNNSPSNCNKHVHAHIFTLLFITISHGRCCCFAFLFFALWHSTISFTALQQEIWFQ